MGIKLEKKNLPFAMAEEIKNLRTGIIFSGENIKTIALTSCTANEGKSTISIELVKSFAELGKKALLIDSDLRKSIIKHKITEGRIGDGLTHYLTGQCELDDIIYTCKEEESDTEFYVIPAGPNTNSPTELLSSDKYSDMLSELRNEYDVVIIDTPPLGAVVDASIIGSKADGTVIVISSGEIDYRAVQDVKEKLLGSGSRILGVALNKVDTSKRNKNYYYKYGKKYDYSYKYGYGEQ